MGLPELPEVPDLPKKGPLLCYGLHCISFLVMVEKEVYWHFNEYLGGVSGPMAEICAAAAAAEPCDRTSVAARRRRMEIRRRRCISGVESMEKTDVLSPKRQRSGISVHPRIVLLKREFNDVKGEDEANQDMMKQETIISELTRSVASEQSPKYGMMSVCGLRRDMEDAVSIRPDFLSRAAGRHHYFGVFDGHGCSHVASWCKDRLHEMVAEEVDKLESVSPPLQMDWKMLMERSFMRMDEDVVVLGGTASGEQRSPICRCELQMPRCDHVGSTAVVAVVTPELIVVANCGDSRAVLCRKGAAVPLSIDHKPDRPDELQRIEAAGGRVIFWDGPRVLGVLAMSRAIGDGYLKPYVTAEPEVTVTEREEEDECLILASDGLWDVVANATACEIVRTCLQSSGEGSEKACSDAATLLTKMSLARRSADNISVVVVDLRRRNPLVKMDRRENVRGEK